MRRRVIVESPLRGTGADEREIAMSYHKNVSYALAAMIDSLHHGEAPFLGHLLYPQVLSDSIPHQRATGISAHMSWIAGAEAMVLYTDLGVSEGMASARVLAEKLGLPIEYRRLYNG